MADPQGTKVVFVGDSGVGKTSLFLRIQGQDFNQEALSTVSGQCARINIRLDKVKTRKLLIWDTAGQEKFRALVPLYFKNASYAIVVFDLGDRESFTGLGAWIDIINQSEAHPDFILIGNKCDMEKRVVTIDEADLYAKQVGAFAYLETSAKRGDNVDEVLGQIVAHNQEPRQQAVGVPLTPAEPAERDGGCC
jgi:Ras-related protein Rab-2A